MSFLAGPLSLSAPLPSRSKLIDASMRLIRQQLDIYQQAVEVIMRCDYQQLRQRMRRERELNVGQRITKFGIDLGLVQILKRDHFYFKRREIVNSKEDM